MATKILVVEDSPTIRRIVKSFLTSEGYEVVMATEPTGVLEIIRDSNPDVVITDIMMPDMDGYTLLGHIRKEKAADSLPVIVMSTKSRETMQDLFAFHDISGYLQKPFEKEELTQLVEKALHERVQ